MVEVDELHFGGAVATADDGWSGWVLKNRLLCCESAFVSCIGELDDGQEGMISEMVALREMGGRLTSGR